MVKLFPHPLGVFRTIPNPPKCRIMQKIDFWPYLVISLVIPYIYIDDYDGYESFPAALRGGDLVMQTSSGKSSRVLIRVLPFTMETPGIREPTRGIHVPGCPFSLNML